MTKGVKTPQSLYSLPIMIINFAQTSSDHFLTCSSVGVTLVVASLAYQTKDAKYVQKGRSVSPCKSTRAFSVAAQRVFLQATLQASDSCRESTDSGRGQRFLPEMSRGNLWGKETLFQKQSFF